MYGTDCSNNKELFVIPGENMFFTHMLINNTDNEI